MRLFIAVEMSTTVKARASIVIEELRSRVARVAPRAKITWSAPERIHLTVRFIGDADDVRTHAIRAALGPMVDAPACDVTVEGIGAFPFTGPPRVLWAGVTEGRDGLSKVERAVSQRLETLVPVEDRPYSPHLTLGRVKDPAGLSRATLFDGLADQPFGTVHVDAITLYESRLSPKGARHVPLQRTALRRRA